MEMLLHHVLHHQLINTDAQHVWSSKRLWLVIAKHRRDALDAAIHRKRARPEVPCCSLLHVIQCLSIISQIVQME